MNEFIITERSNIVAIADAVRNKTGESSEITLGEIIDGINSIMIDNSTSDANATSSDILSGKTAYVNGKKITGAIKTVEQATPNITVGSNGLITATANQTSGYVIEGSKFVTEQLACQLEKTIIPNTADQVAVSSGRYTCGDIIVCGDVNLVSENIKSGVSIFGVEGNYVGSESGGSGEGSGSGIICHAVATVESDSGSITFSGLQGEPIMYSIVINEEITQTSISSLKGKWYIENHISGNNISSTQAVSINPSIYSVFSRTRHGTGYLSATYGNGTLTLTDAGLATYPMNFRTGYTYTLSYVVASA